MFVSKAAAPKHTQNPRKNLWNLKNIAFIEFLEFYGQTTFTELTKYFSRYEPNAEIAFNFLPAFNNIQLSSGNKWHLFYFKYSKLSLI